MDLGLASGTAALKPNAEVLQQAAIFSCYGFKTWRQILRCSLIKNWSLHFLRWNLSWPVLVPPLEKSSHDGISEDDLLGHCSSGDAVSQNCLRSEKPRSHGKAECWHSRGQSRPARPGHQTGDWKGLVGSAFLQLHLLRSVAIPVTRDCSSLSR